jgi:hypothetical protein
MTQPTLADVDRITRLPDPVTRNREITACYHELSAAMATRLGDVANWCTFAAWASHQAGCTIRGEDLQRAVEQRLATSVVLSEVAPEQANRLRAVLRQQAPLRRASVAVARGNLKVFAEIGREFARFLAGTPLPAFLDSLRSGDPPEGQRLLRNAFAAYAKAAQLVDPHQRAQQVLYANLLIGFHEQTRLQPEIREALDIVRHDLEDLRPLLLKQLLPAWWQRARHFLAGTFRRKMPLDVVIDRLIDEVCREIREITTAELMTLELPTGIVRLGTKLNTRYPATLEQINDAALAALIERIESGYANIATRDRDWSDFDYRMHFIGGLFRSYQERAEMLQAPVPA